MLLKQKITSYTFIGFIFSALLAVFLLAPTASAVLPSGENGNGNNETGATNMPNTSGMSDACDVETSIIPVDCSTGGNPIWGILILVINILTAGIGIVAVGGIVYAGILWSSAEDKNAQIVKAKETLFNVILGLAAYALLYAFLQFLIPGGAFR